MSYRFLRNSYNKYREMQATLYGRPLTAFARAAGDVIFSTAVVAAEDVFISSRDAYVRAVALPTGSGKSTSAYAMIAACAEADPDFSAAYIVPTVKMGLEAQEGIEMLIGEGSTVLWNYCTKHKGRDELEVERELGYLPTRVVNKACLPDSRIVILTHNFLEREIQERKDLGCRKYKGKPRSFIFIDEYPSLLEVIDMKPSQVEALCEILARKNTGHPWLPVLASTVNNMNLVMFSEGQTYFPTALLTREEGNLLVNGTSEYLLQFVEDDLSVELKRKQAEGMKATIDFLIAASKGCSFYSRIDKTFFAYRLNFELEQPGFILLDATADLSGLVTLHPKVECVDVPQVDYSQLSVFHMKHPKGFKNVSKVTRRAESGEAYGKWIKGTVLANTQADDDVLVVTHKRVLNLKFIEESNDPGSPLDWEGRKVNTQNWGAGIGLNKFKDKTHVFLFGEFYQKRALTISDVHGWSTLPLTEEHLKQAEGRRLGGNEYGPKGIYLEPYEGHLLRWSKQLSMRGAARNIDEEGKCMPMKLYTSMDLNRLLKHFDRLFPGADVPRPAKESLDPSDIVMTSSLSGREGLISILSECKKTVIGADEIERMTGIQPKHLKRELDSYIVFNIANQYGWKLMSARDLGKAGRQKYLVNSQLSNQLYKLVS